MPTPHLSLSWLERVDRVLRERAMDGQFHLSFLRQALSELGFTKFRYFELASSDVVDQFYYVLRYTGPDLPPIPSESTILPARETNQYQPENELRPRVSLGCNPDNIDQLNIFQETIGVADLPCVFVPILEGNNLVAKFCLSWKGSVDELTTEDNSSLVILSRLCARYIRLSQDVAVESLSPEVEAIGFQGEVEGFIDAHEQFIRILNKICPSSVAAIFEHNWSNDQLTKIYEISEPSLTLEPFAESYFRGHHLTGFALTRKHPFLIPRLNGLQAGSLPKLEDESFRRHSELISKDLSVIYAAYESGHRDFVLRLTSRSRGPSPYFSDLDLQAISRLCRRFGYHSNNFANQKNLQFVNELFHISISDFSRYTNVIDRFEEIYRRVFSSPMVLLAKSRTSSAIEHIYCRDTALVGAAAKVNPDALAKLGKLATPNPVVVMSASKFNALVNAPCVVDPSATHAFIMPLSDAELEGIIYTAISSKNNESEIFSAIKPKTKQTLSLISAIIASGISASAQHITTENAKRLIGHIGHEIETPIAKLSDAAQAALYRAKNALETLSRGGSLTSLTSFIEESIRATQEQSRAISLLMDVAIDMAQETENRLDVTYRRFDLTALLEDVDATVSREIDRYQYPSIRVFFVFNPRAKQLHEFVGDKGLISKIFLNLFRNALKYSYPQSPGQPIEIKVNAAVQTKFIDFEIINWGVPVGASELERIFLAFQRGEATDPVRARRGMGLGLYIARRFAAAHGGNVWCRSSEPTLDDPARRYREGHRTTFVLRLPTNLAVSTSKVRLS